MEVRENRLSTDYTDNYSYLEEHQQTQTQRKIVDDWIAQHKDDFVSHAAWSQDAEKNRKFINRGWVKPIDVKIIGEIIRSGSVMPAEAILYSKGDVEYEGSFFGCRETKCLIPNELDSEVREVFELKKDEAEELSLLQESQKKVSEEDYRAFKSLKKKIISSLNEEKRETYLYIEEKDRYTPTSSRPNESLMKLEEVGLNNLSEEERSQFHKLSLNRTVFEERPRLKHLIRKSKGIDLIFNKINRDNIKVRGCPSSRYHQLLSVPFRCFSPEDLALRYFSDNDTLKKYLTHKFQLWTKKGIPLDVVNKALVLANDKVLGLESSKLGNTIRTASNRINWNYGDNVILRGNAKDLACFKIGNETALLAPWQNEGKYFTLPLSQEDTLLIGPKSNLQPHAEELNKLGAKYVYLESLTEEQANFFNVPEELRYIEVNSKIG